MENITTYVAIPKEEWQQIITTLRRLEERMLARKEDEWITMRKACEILGVTTASFRNYRKNNKIKVSQVGRNILVSRSELNKLIKSKSL